MMSSESLLKLKNTALEFSADIAPFKTALPELDKLLVDLRREATTVVGDKKQTLVEDREEETLQEEKIDSLFKTIRSKLREIEQNAKENITIVDGQSRAQAAYDALLVLAKFSPLNNDNESVISRERYDELMKSEDQHIVYTSTGYWFVVQSLVMFHNTRKALSSAWRKARLSEIFS